MRSWIPVLTILLGGCLAHYPRADEPLEFMEANHLGFPIDTDQVLEAEAAIHLLLWNGLDRADVWTTDGTHLTAAFSFLATVRMYDAISNPVASPSYQPRLKFQLLRVTAPEKEAAGFMGRLGRIGGLELALAHHSNGQKGCALADHARTEGDADFDCTPTTDPPTTALNLDGGSFTRNYLGLGAWGKLLLPSAAGGAVALSVTGGAAVEWNFPCARGGCIEPEMRDRYGAAIVRWTLEADLLLVRDFQRTIPLVGRVGLDARLRGSVLGSTHLGLAGRDPYGDLAVEVSYLPRYPRGFSVGPYVRYHRGSDYLNIRFEERLDTLTVGILLDSAPTERSDGGHPP